MTDYDDPSIVHAGVEMCPVHDTFDMEEDCEGCEREAAHRSKVIGDMQTEAQNRARGLAKHGVPFGQPALDMIKVQIMWETMFHGRQAFIAEAEMGRRAILMMRDMQREAMAQSGMTPGGLTIVGKNGGPKQ